jgi:hypothetical protein
MKIETKVKTCMAIIVAIGPRKSHPAARKARDIMGELFLGIILFLPNVKVHTPLPASASAETEVKP